MAGRTIYCGYCGEEHEEDSSILTVHQRILGSNPHTHSKKEVSDIGTMEVKLSLVDLAVKVNLVLIRRAQLLKAAGIVSKGWKSPV